MKPTLRPSHRRAVSELLDRTEEAFRRSHLVGVLYPMTNPRSLKTAEGLADAMLQELLKAGHIQRRGHLHYTKVLRERTRLDGSSIPELPEPVSLELTTKCPAKWIAVDTETGDVWAGSSKGWKRATGADRKLAILALQRKAASLTT